MREQSCEIVGVEGMSHMMISSSQPVARFVLWGNRGYNSFNNTVVFRGETMDLNKVLNGLEELIEKCRPYSSMMVKY